MYNFDNHESFVIGKATKDEQERIHTIVYSRICFDHKADGICEHGYCYALTELRAAIKGVELRDE
jgi:hypothetical protein